MSRVRPVNKKSKTKTTERKREMEGGGESVRGVGRGERGNNGDRQMGGETEGEGRV